MSLEQLKYPIGKFKKPDIITKEIITNWILTISELPERLKNEVSHLTEEQLDTPYRPDGWTVRQVVHHLADSHINSFMRFKLTLTENTPTIKPYFENLWAETIDGKLFPIESSMKILEGLHERWTALLNSLTDEQLKQTFIHPEHGKEIRLDELIGLYDWHCRHHFAHIMILKEQKQWK